MKKESFWTFISVVAATEFFLGVVIGDDMLRDPDSRRLPNWMAVIHATAIGGAVLIGQRFFKRGPVTMIVVVLSLIVGYAFAMAFLR